MNERHPITRQRVVYTMPGTSEVTVARDVTYKTGRPGMDVYHPVERGGLLPAVIFVVGFSDVGARNRLGCAAKEMASCEDWARLVAASGMIAVTYENRDPTADLHAVFDHLRDHGAALGIDPNRLAVWACSGNGPMGLHAIVEQSVTCGVLLYPYLLDIGDATDVADAAMQWGFVNAAAGVLVHTIPADVPLLIVRAGRDQFAGVNTAIDRFVAGALATNLSLTIINYADAPHAFDVSDDRASTRDVIESVLTFLRTMGPRGRQYG